MPEERPPKRQRVAAYALITRSTGDPGDPTAAAEVLLTRLAPHVRFDGWTLPGGGVDHGEHPRDALRREIYEETGLHAEPGAVIDVYSSHFTGARPDGLVEDYHGIGLIFEAEVLPESVAVEPHVVEVDGSTDSAAWLPVDKAASLALSGAARLALTLIRHHADETRSPG
jgi:8-oxo-dGTP pyrophosphatase MutT (NUDIX family)